MNALNSSSDDVAECPLCMEPLEVDDLNFYPCTCGYQICRFCWHRIRTDENELCPACRKEYPENPADFTPLTQEEMIAFKSQKRQRDQQRKQKITENRKHLANVRVVQKNLVFVVGLPPRLADADILKKHEYFGKYGKIHKVVINPSTTYAGVQGPSASAYVTYVNNTDALRAIQSVNNILIDGRLIKTSLGTTKYCSHFMKNQQCPKGDCMYLHELGDPEASFTKEEMHQGKHQEYEKRLHDALIATSGIGAVSGMGQLSSNVIGNVAGSTIAMSTSTQTSKIGEVCKTSNNNTLPTTSVIFSSSSSVSVNTTAASVIAVVSDTQQKEAWPSLSISPVNNKDTGTGSGKHKKEKAKHDKTKHDKITKIKNNKISNISANTSSSFDLTNKENNHPSYSLTNITPLLADSTKIVAPEEKGDKIKTPTEIYSANRQNHDLLHHQQKTKIDKSLDADDEVKQIEDFEAQTGLSNIKDSVDSCYQEHIGNINVDLNESNIEERSLSSSSNISSSSSTNNSESTSTLSENTSGKTTPGGCIETSSLIEKLPNTFVNTESEYTRENGQSDSKLNLVGSVYSKKVEIIANKSISNHNYNENNIHTPMINGDVLQFANANESNNLQDTTAAFSKLNIFDDNNSFFSSSAGSSFQQSYLHKNKPEVEIRQIKLNNANSSQLPDLLNGIDGYKSKALNSNEWDALKTDMVQNKKEMKDHLQQEQLHRHQPLHHHQHYQQQEFLRMQELQSRNSLLNNIGFSQNNRPRNDFSSVGHNLHNSADLSRLSQSALMQHQQHLIQHTSHPTDQIISNSLFGTNMSKFFDFHKNQQQQLHQQFPIVGEHSHMSLLENNRINSQLLEQSNGFLKQQHKQKLLEKFDPMKQQQQQLAQSQLTSKQPNLQNHSTNQFQFTRSATIDDELGFDPFTETRKALAELMENEVVEQQNINVASNINSTQASTKNQQQMDNPQRARMPPPGFNHMNAFGFGVPRAQNNSNILPFMNVTSNSATNNGPNGITTQQMHMPNQSWNPHLPAVQHQLLSDSQHTTSHQLNSNQSGGYNNKAYGNNDWTAMDPAILSFRQFSFPQQQQQHPQQQDLFLQHLTQQQPAAQGFGSQPQIHGNVQNTALNMQPTSQAQVNANVQGMLEYLKTRQFV